MGSILVPVNDPNAIEAYVEHGADEFYMGFFDPMWTTAFGPLVDLNRMSGFGARANSCDLGHLVSAAQTVKSFGKKLFVTVNAAVYGRQTHDTLRAYFQTFAAYGVDGVILSGPELVDDALACGLQPVASTMCGIYNHHIAQFYLNCGVSRMILPRDLSLEEIRAIAERFPDAEIEVFLMRNGCVLSDSHCLGTHLPQTGALCGEMRRASRTLRSSIGLDALRENSNLYYQELHRHACGLCALWDLEQMGIKSYKIVGRCDDSASIINDIQIINNNIEIAISCNNREEYLDSMNAHPYANVVCDRGLNCYYPEVRLP